MSAAAAAVLLSGGVLPLPAGSLFGGAAPVHAAGEEGLLLKDSASWAAEAIQNVNRLGIMTGDAQGNFRAQGNLTRQEFAVILTRVLKLSAAPVTKVSYKDVKSGSWAAPAIEAMKQQGVMLGGGDGLFRPTAPLTRQEMAVTLVRALKADASGLGAQLSVKDKAQISLWAKDAVQYLLQSGIMKGDGTNFAPSRFVQRQEMAVVINQSLDSFNLTASQTIDRVEDGMVVVDGEAYRVADSLKGLFSSENAAALKNAAVRIEMKEGIVAKVTYLELRSAGKLPAAGQEEFSGNLVLDAHGAKIEGDAAVTADFVTLRNMEISGNLRIDSKMEHDFYADHVSVQGQTVVDGGDSNTVVFDHARLAGVDITKTEVHVRFISDSVVGHIALHTSAQVEAGEGVTIPLLQLLSGSAEVKLSGNIKSVEMPVSGNQTISGSAAIGELKVSGSGTARVNISGSVGVLSAGGSAVKIVLGSSASVHDLWLPAGSAPADIVSGYDQVKAQIGAVNGVSNGPAASGGVSAPATSSGAGGGGGSAGSGSEGGSFPSQPAPPASTQNGELKADVVSGRAFYTQYAKDDAVIRLIRKDSAGTEIPAGSLSDLSVKLDGQTLSPADYTVNEAVAEVTLSKQLLNTLQAGDHAGQLTLGALSASFTLEARIPHAPVMQNLGAKSLRLDSAPLIFTASNLATDPDGDDLSIDPASVSVPTPDIVSATVEEGQLKIEPLALGQTSVSVTIVDNSAVLGQDRVEVTIPVSVAGDMLDAELLYTDQIRQNDAGTDLPIGIKLYDSLGNLVEHPQLAELKVANGTELIAGQDYIVDDTEGNVYLTLSYLNSLSSGTHTIQLSYAGLTAEVALTVLSPDPIIVTSVRNVNEATDIASMRNALEAAGLKLELALYQSLSETQKNQIAGSVLLGAGTYSNRADIQDALDLALNDLLNGGDESTAIAAVNQAATVEEMLSALRSPQLHLDNEDYSSLEPREVATLAQYFLDQIASNHKVYTSRDDIQNDFDSIISMIYEDWYKIVDDVNALKIGYVSGDSRSGVTRDVTLPTAGTVHGSQITWTSSNPTVISATGKVTQPIGASVKVTLSALFKNRYEEYTAVITLTVLPASAPPLSAGTSAGFTLSDQAAASLADGTNSLQVTRDLTVAELIGMLRYNEGQGTVKIYTDSSLQTEADPNMPVTSGMTVVGEAPLANGQERKMLQVELGTGGSSASPQTSEAAQSAQESSPEGQPEGAASEAASTDEEGTAQPDAAPSPEQAPKAPQQLYPQ
ncbi:hypothetical protein DCC85_04430 [Paenibacillus sp. CAA11]|nr:hypothetical protein DCC85_04430 [Paenibacillus sp. CAA11]